MGQVVLNNFCDKCSLICYLYMHTYVELIQNKYQMLGDLWVTFNVTLHSGNSEKNSHSVNEMTSINTA